MPAMNDVRIFVSGPLASRDQVGLLDWFAMEYGFRFNLPSGEQSDAAQPAVHAASEAGTVLSMSALTSRLDLEAAETMAGEMTARNMAFRIEFYDGDAEIVRHIGWKPGLSGLARAWSDQHGGAYVDLKTLEAAFHTGSLRNLIEKARIAIGNDDAMREGVSLTGTLARQAARTPSADEPSFG